MTPLPHPAIGPDPRRVRRARRLALALVAALLAILAAWHATRYSARTALLVSALAFVPWLIALPGLGRGRRTTYVGALLLTTPYLGYGLMEVLANPGARPFAAAALFVALALAATLVAYLRVSRPPAPAPT